MPILFQYKFSNDVQEILLWFWLITEMPFRSGPSNEIDPWNNSTNKMYI